MVAKKRKSKRQTLQQKYKIQKRTKEHHKRLKKGAIAGARKQKIEGGIPNAWPFKEDLLKEISAAKEKIEEMKQRTKEKRAEEFSKRRSGGGDDMDLGGDAPSKNVLHNVPTGVTFADPERDDEVYTGLDMKSAAAGQNSRRAYLRELRKVVDGSDVILQVLDARDPLGTRSTAVEDMVLGKSGKKLVYVLNKADLVPREVLAGWLAFLRKSHAAVPFKCNTQAQKGNLGRATGKVSHQQEGALQTNQAVGAEELLGLLKNYARIGDTKSVIVVGIVGFPNVGKSSLINSLMRTRAVGVSSMPGFTKVAQEVILDKNIRLMDSPGIVFADGDTAATALRNCVNVEEMEDVMTPLQAILERCPQGYLMQLYSIPKFKPLDCMGFLALVARVTGKLKKGGIPNTDAAARTVLHDWNNGKIRYYCKAPAKEDGGGAGEGDSKVLSAFSEGMDLAAMEADDVRVLNALEAAVDGGADSGYVSMATVGPTLTAVSLDGNAEAAEGFGVAAVKKSKKSRAGGGEAGEDMMSDGGSVVSARSSRSSKEKLVPLLSRTALAAQSMDYEAPQEGATGRKTLKASAKKSKKDARRMNKEEGEGEAYSFEQDYK